MTKPETPKADTRNVYQRLAAAMANVAYVQKNKPAGMQYSIVSHDAVTAKVRPVLLAEGIVYHPHQMDYSQNGNRTEVFLMVRFLNIDDPADFFDVPSLGYGVDPQDKGPGKAVSYAVKYALLKSLGLETGDDADLESKPHEISPEQFVALRDIVESTGSDEKRLLKHFSAPSLEQFPPDKYEAAMKMLRTKPTAEKPKQQTDNADLNDDKIPY